MRESRTYVLCGGRAMKRTSLPLRAALLRLLTAGFGTKGRSPPCTQIGRYRREADKPANELRVKSAALDPERSIGGRHCCDAQRGISYHGVVGCDPRIEGST